MLRIEYSRVVIRSPAEQLHCRVADDLLGVGVGSLLDGEREDGRLGFGHGESAGEGGAGGKGGRAYPRISRVYDRGVRN